MGVQKVVGQKNHCMGSRWQKRWRGSQINACCMGSRWLAGWLGVLVGRWMMAGWTVEGRKEGSERENGWEQTGGWVNGPACEGGDRAEGVLPSPGPAPRSDMGFCCPCCLGNPWKSRTTGPLAF